MAAVPTALQLSQNVFLFQTNLEVKAAEDVAVSLSSQVGYHFNFQVVPPVFAHCDVETGKRLSLLGLDPYCTTPE